MRDDIIGDKQVRCTTFALQSLCEFSREELVQRVDSGLARGLGLLRRGFNAKHPNVVLEEVA